MKFPNEALNRNLDTDSPVGKFESDLTQEQMKELVRNLDVAKIQNFEFKNALVDVAPEAKTVLGDKGNFKESLLALSTVSNVTPPLNKEDFMKFIGTQSILLNEADWDKIEKNGALYVTSYVKNLAFQTYTKNPNGIGGRRETVKKLYELFTDNPSMELLAELDQKYKDKDPDLMKKVEEFSAETGSSLSETSGSIGYVYALEKQVHTGADDWKRVMDDSLFPTVTFNYEGHTFEVFRSPSDNTADASLQNNDNPHFLKRFGSWYNLKMDGHQYKEKTYDPNHPTLEGSGGIYDGFNSWRKWIGYRDIVVKNTE